MTRDLIGDGPSGSIGRDIETPIRGRIDNFSDIVHGEDLEFRENTQKNFEIHRISLLATAPPWILSRFSANQLVTLAGAASGFLAGIIVCPLDVVKTRLQAQGAMAGNPIQYKGFFNAFQTIFKNEGIRGLYRGLVPITIGYLPTWTIYFTIYERAKGFYPTFLRNNVGIDSEAIAHCCSALTAGMTSSIAVNPIWVVKTRLMIQTGSKKVMEQTKINEQIRKQPSLQTKIPIINQTGVDLVNRLDPASGRTYYTGTFNAIKTMYREEGIRVFYRGLVPSLFGLVHVGIHFPVYEKLKKVLDVHTIDNSITTKENKGLLWRLFAASSVSKMIASTITYPHEILRTRMQIQSSNNKQTKLIDSIIKIYQKEGLKGFYAGYVINLARTVPASAVTLVSFEYFKTYLLEISAHE